MRGGDKSQDGSNDCTDADQQSGLFTVFHIDPAMSEEIYIDEMAAETEVGARGLIEQCFAGHTILIIRKQTGGKKVDAYPNARFINGKFRASPSA